MILPVLLTSPPSLVNQMACTSPAPVCSAITQPWGVVLRHEYVPSNPSLLSPVRSKLENCLVCTPTGSSGSRSSLR